MQRRTALLLAAIAGLGAALTGQDAEPAFPAQLAPLERFAFARDTPGQTWALAVGDVDGDGAPDIVRGSYAGGVPELWGNDGRGAFERRAQSLPPTSMSVYAIALGDVDGDGDLDILFGNQKGDRLYVNDGRGRFADGSDARLPGGGGGQTRGVTLGDIDVDGDLDLLTADQEGQNRVLLNDGSGRFAPADAWQLPQERLHTETIVLADVDGDGRLDAYVCNGDKDGGPGEQNRLLLGKGERGFVDVTATHLPEASDRAFDAAFIDIDADLDLDLVTANMGKAANAGEVTRLSVYANDGHGRFTDVTDRAMPEHEGCYASIAVGDIDEDGDPDVLLGSYGEQPIDVLVNEAGRFTLGGAARIAPVKGGCGTLALADLDGDGDLDLVVGRWNGPDEVLFNRLRHAYAPQPPKPGQPYRIEFWAWSSGQGPPPQVHPYVSEPFGAARAVRDPLAEMHLAPPNMVALPRGRVEASAGHLTVELELPADPALCGTELRARAMVLDAPHYRASNLLVDQVQR